MPANIRIDGLTQNEESVRDFDALAAVTVDDPTAVTHLWAILDWPLGTAFDQAWLAGGGSGGPGTPAITFTPDREGTWVFQLTDTNDSATDTKIMAVRHLRTNIRPPGTGETTESADTNVISSAGLVANHRGWAHRRNTDLDRLDELCTSGGLQLCYLDDAAGVPGTISAGMLVSFSTTAARQIDATTGERVPVVVLADANVTADQRYAGAIKAGRVVQVANPGPNQFEYVTTLIPNQSYVWVSRSGIVEGGAVGTLDLTAYTNGDYVYISDTPGVPARRIDLFEDATAPAVMGLAGVVVRNTNPGAIVVYPAMALTGRSNVQSTWRYNGLGEFSGLRLGRPDSVTVAGEADGTIEVIANNAEAVPIPQGTVAMLRSNGVVVDAYIGDSSLSPAVSTNRRFGVVGVAVETVAAGDLGHFTVYGQAPNALTTAAAQGVLFLGSSTAVTGDVSGRAVLPIRLQDDAATFGNQMIPVGTWDGAELMVGAFQDYGLLAAVESDRGFELETVANSDQLNMHRGNVFQGADGQADVDFPNTFIDQKLYPITLYEATVEGQALYDELGTDLAGQVTAGLNDSPGAIFSAAPNGLQTSFYLDSRYVSEEYPVIVRMFGYTDDIVAGTLSVTMSARLNACDETSQAFTAMTTDTEIMSGGAARTGLIFEFPFYGANDFYGNLPPISGTDPHTIDIRLVRNDVVPSTITVSKVVLSVYAPNKGLGTNFPNVLYEYKVPGYSLVDQLTGAVNIVDAVATVGSSTPGCQVSGVGGAEPAGYVILDNRHDMTTNVTVRMTVKFIGPNGGAIDFRLIARVEDCAGVYDEDITVGADLNVVDSESPVATGGPAYRSVCYTWTIAAAAFDANSAAIHWHIARTTADLAGELFCMITDLTFEQVAVHNAGILQEVYENKIDAVSVIDSNDGLYNVTQQADYLGFLFASGGSEEFVAAVRFDERYDMRQPLEVRAIGWTTAAVVAPGVGLNLTIGNTHDLETTLPARAAYTFTSHMDTVVAAPGANQVTIVCHTFSIPARRIWHALGATRNTLLPNSHSSLFCRITRTDADPAAYHLLGVDVRTVNGNLQEVPERFIDVNENISDATKSLIVSGTSRMDRNRSILTSAHRYIWHYGLDGAITVGASGSRDLHPAAITGTTHNPVLPLGTGTFIPFNIAILGVYGWYYDMLTTATLDNSTLNLHVVEVPDDGSAVQDTSQGVSNFPLVITGQPNGTWRWTGNNMNFEAGDSTPLPLVMLPENYDSGVRSMWALQVTFTNADAGNAIDLLANVQVEVALLPSNVR